MRRLFAVFCFVAATAGATAQWQAVLASSPPSGFTAATAVFDGTNDYIGIASGPTGLADGKAFTQSFWIKMGAGSDGTLYTIRSVSSNRFNVERTAANLIRVIGLNSSGTTQVDISTTSTVTVASGWVHVFIVFDSATAGTTNLRKIYLNGVSDSLTVTTFISTSLIDASNTLFRVGANSSAANKLNAALAEFWLDDVYLDGPTKFASGGHPISLGATGNTPTGSAPACYYSLSGSGDTWATDSSGNANNLTVTGALTTTTAP